MASFPTVLMTNTGQLHRSYDFGVVSKCTNSLTYVFWYAESCWRQNSG